MGLFSLSPPIIAIITIGNCHSTVQLLGKLPLKLYSLHIGNGDCGNLSCDSYECQSPERGNHAEKDTQPSYEFDEA